MFALQDPMHINQPCWMLTAAPGLVECRLVYITETHATVLLPDDVVLPQTCDLFFRADAKVGRNCYVIRQIKDKAELAIMGKIDTNVGRDVFQL
jgi:hypothetical protein